MKALVLNAGSSSQKSSLYELGTELPKNPPEPLWQAKIEWTGEAQRGRVARLEVRTQQGATLCEEHAAPARLPILARALAALWEGPARVIASPADVDMVGHRVVHGGREYVKPTLVTREVKEGIQRLARLAPLHEGAELEGMELIEKLVGSLPQLAVFDTAFHQTLPSPAAVYPGPYEWLERGIRRYGFHGISHQYVAERAAQLLRRGSESLRLISCHLGNGCSLAAVSGGRSIDTTMGFTPLEGLMMGTRSGSLDPGILLYLLRQEGYSVEKLDRVSNLESGLLGISGVSGDMRRVLEARAAGNERAKLAFDIFMHRLRASMGAMLASLGGLDVVAFTGGIGENVPEVRQAACEPFGFLGLKLDLERNLRRSKDEDVAAADSAVRALVIQAQEDWSIARECWRWTASGGR